MRTFNWYILCTIFSSLVFCQKLDIQTVEKLVINNNPDLLAAEKQIYIQVGQLEQSRKLANPVLEFESIPGQETVTAGFLKQTIILGGKRRKNIKLNELELKKTRLEYEILIQEKLRDAFKSFTRILHLQKIKIFQNDRILIADNLLNAVSRKVEAGKLSPAEKSRARIQLYQENLKKRTIENSLKTTWHSLSALWGENNSSFDSAEGDLDLIPKIPAAVPIENIPSFEVLTLSRKILKTTARSERAKAIPDIEISAGLVRNEISGDTYQAGLSIPFPVFNRNQGNIKSAVSKLEQSQLELKALESQLNTRISNLQTELETLAADISDLKENIIPEARNAYTIIADGYLNGRFTYLDVVDSQKMWFNSREQYLEALKAYHETIFEFNRIIGNSYIRENK